MGKERLALTVCGGTIGVLRVMAVEFGLLTTSGGPQHGQGNLSAMLSAIASGDLVVVRKYEQSELFDESEGAT